MLVGFRCVSVTFPTTTLDHLKTQLASEGVAFGPLWVSLWLLRPWLSSHPGCPAAQLPGGAAHRSFSRRSRTSSTTSAPVALRTPRNPTPGFELRRPKRASPKRFFLRGQERGAPETMDIARNCWTETDWPPLHLPVKPQQHLGCCHGLFTHCTSSTFSGK